MDLDGAPDSSQPIRTPRRKRQRVMEISASDSQSSFDPISPVRYLNSTPRRPYKRLCTPNSESRRQSAPSRIFSSMRVASPTIPQRLSDTDPTVLSLKHEKKVCFKSICCVISSALTSRSLITHQHGSSKLPKLCVASFPMIYSKLKTVKHDVLTATDYSN